MCCGYCVCVSLQILYVVSCCRCCSYIIERLTDVKAITPLRLFGTTLGAPAKGPCTYSPAPCNRKRCMLHHHCSIHSTQLCVRLLLCASTVAAVADAIINVTFEFSASTPPDQIVDGVISTVSEGLFNGTNSTAVSTDKFSVRHCAWRWLRTHAPPKAS